MRQDENTAGMSADDTRGEMRRRFDAVNEAALNKRRISRGEITAEELEATQSASLAAAVDPWAMQTHAAPADDADTTSPGGDEATGSMSAE
ncbi:MAG: hypothetical protein M3014_08065 [Chloroflexota bacterium]|nr:hypothetical protein [Chloroflexota bacterium]